MKYIFVHIPKTAGSLIKTLLKISPKTPNIIVPQIKSLKNSLGHYKISEIESEFLGKNLNYFSITRNPYDRIYSVWKFLMLKNGSINALPKVEKDFCDFLISLKNKKYNNMFFDSQLSFLDNNFEKVTVIKYEEKNKIEDFLEENDVRWMDKKINASPGIFYKNAYVDDSYKSIVKELYEEDFKTFDYDFEL